MGQAPYCDGRPMLFLRPRSTGTVRQGARVFILLLLGAWSLFTLTSIPELRTAAPFAAATVVIAMSWWLVPVLLVATLILHQASRLVSSRVDALKIGAVVALLAWLGFFGAFSLQNFIPAYLTNPMFERWYLGPVILATVVALYAFPWFVFCLWPKRAAEAG